jgi:tetratricopeptide (TPR) repeat protein
MGDLASAYEAAGKLDLAVPLLEQTFARKKAKLGPDHPNTLQGMGNLAMGYQRVGKLDLAIPLLEETLRLEKAKLGRDNPDTLVTTSNLAAAYRAIGKLDLALPLFEDAAQGVERLKFQSEHAEPLVRNAIHALEEVKQFDRAEVWWRKWLAAVKHRAGAESVAYSGTLASFGSNLLRQKKWADAEATLRECLALRAKAEPEAWTTFNTKSLLGGSLLGQQKYAEAELLLLAGYDGMKQRANAIPKEGRVRLPEAAGRLVQLYEAWGKPDEAAKWLDELWAWAETPDAAK